MNSQKCNVDNVIKSCYLYLRVSSDDQVLNYSLDTQEEICRATAQRLGYSVVEVFREEGKSAKNISGRPILIKMLEMCRKNKQNISAVVVYRIDRLARETSDYLAIRKQLAESATAVISATEPTGSSPTDKMVETMLAAFAELDNSTRAERAKNGIRKRFEAGLPLGSIPIGYRKGLGKIWEADPTTFETMKKVWDLMATGTLSTKQIAKQMNDWGLRQVWGGREYKIRPQNMSRLFKNKFYMGVLSYPGYSDEVPSKAPAMVNSETYYRIQSVLAGKNTFQGTRNYENADFPLRRIVKCGKCGASLTGGWVSGKNRKYAYYFCSADTKHKSIPVKELEDAIYGKLAEIQPSPEILDLFSQTVKNAYAERTSQLQEVKKKSETTLDELKAMRLIIAEKNLKGIYTDEVYKELAASLEERMIVSMSVKNENVLDIYQIEETINFTRALFSDLTRAYQFSDSQQVKTLLCSIYPHGLTWTYPGFLNTEISPIFSNITSSRGFNFASGEELERWFEHFYTWVKPIFNAFPKYHLAYAS